MAAQSILIIEDEHALGTALSFAVRRAGHLPVLSASGAAGLEALKKQAFSAVVLDIGLPDMSGLAVLERLRQKDKTLPVLVITAHGTLDHAIAAQKLGATDYLTKPLDLRQFETAFTALLSRGEPVVEKAAPTTGALRTATLIGGAPCLQEVFLGIARACAGGELRALITGPSGSGKTLAAQVIHANSPRSSAPLRFLDCTTADAAALDAALAEKAGTLVLEEITRLSVPMQARLAAWLAEPEPGKRVRVLATTSTDPREAVTAEHWRADIYYAFSTLEIPMPPLNERSGDIPALSAFFLGLREGAAVPVITPPAMQALQCYAWPGNVRELRHVLEHAASLSRGGPIFASHLPAHIGSSHAGQSQPVMAGELDAALARWVDTQLAVKGGELPPTYDALLDQVEAAMLRHLLERHEQKPTRLATALRMNRATLRQKLRRAGLQRDDV